MTGPERQNDMHRYTYGLYNTSLRFSQRGGIYHHSNHFDFAEMQGDLR